MKKLAVRIHNMNKRQLHFSFLEFIFWGAFAAYYPFVVVILQERGFSNTVIGTIMAINSLIVVFAQPFWGMVSDRIRSVKKVFIFNLLVAIILVQAVPYISLTVFVGLILALVTFFESPLSPLLDSWVVRGIKAEGNISYGSIRLWGSAGYSIIVYICGRLINKFSTANVLFPFFLIMGCLAAFACTGIKADSLVPDGGARRLYIGRLFKNHQYVYYLIFAVILAIPHRSAFIFLPNLMKSVGGTDGDLGLINAVMAISEIPAFLYSRVLFRRYKPVNVILFSSIFYILRQVLYLIASQPIHVFLVQLLQGPSFALFVNGSVYYIDELAPEELKATAQTFATSMYFGLSGIVGSYGGGWVIDNYGLKNMYWIGFCISLVISVLFLLSVNIGRTSKYGNVDNGKMEICKCINN
ncbi:MAG: MFS transporter [Clostridiales bacterium]|nr:MFS transporter [Clostridiales bacterium]